MVMHSIGNYIGYSHKKLYLVCFRVLWKAQTNPKIIAVYFVADEFIIEYKIRLVISNTTKVFVN